MADEVQKSTFEYEIGGRLITFKSSQRPQILAMQRHLHWIQEDFNKKVEAAATEEEKIDLYRKGVDTVDQFVWDLVESKFVDPEDIQHVNLAIAMGAATIEDAYAIFSNGQKAPVEPDDKPASVKPRKASVAKKTTAKAANAGRNRR